MLTLSRGAKNSSRTNLKGSMQAIGGARLSIWLNSFHVFPRRGLVITSLLVAAEEPPELGGFLVPDGISATFISLPTKKTSFQHRSCQRLRFCSRGVVEVQQVVMLQWGTPAFPLAWKPTAVSSQVTAAESVTLRVHVFFEVSHESGVCACSAQGA